MQILFKERDTDKTKMADRICRLKAQIGLKTTVWRCSPATACGDANPRRTPRMLTRCISLVLVRNARASNNSDNAACCHVARHTKWSTRAFMGKTQPPLFHTSSHPSPTKDVMLLEQKLSRNNDIS